jgi:hypothetical protein
MALWLSAKIKKPRNRGLWYQLESNQRHKDFQSFALPTELWYLNWGVQMYKKNVGLVELEQLYAVN